MPRQLHGRRKWQGLDVSIENRRGSVRKWGEGPHEQTLMRWDYGYIRRTEAADGDHVDVFLGPHPDTAPYVYVVRTMAAPDFRRYDEDKCMIGWPSETAARAAFHEHYNDPRFLGKIDTYPVADIVEAVQRTWHAPGMVKGAGHKYVRRWRGKDGSYDYEYQHDRPLTAATRRAEDELEAGTFGSPVPGMPDYTDQAAVPSEWATPSQIAAIADAAGLSGLAREAFVQDPDAGLQRDRLYADPLVEEALNTAWREYQGKRKVAVKKERAIVETFRPPARVMPQEDLFRPAGEPAVVYASGSNHAGEIRGFASLGMGVGVAADQVNADAVKALLEVDVPVFVDSGAFGEVGPNLAVVAPINHAEWMRRLNLYARLARKLGPRLTVVAPDQVGNQGETLRRLRRYAPQMQAIATTGAKILLPLQGGELPMAEFERRARTVLGAPAVPAIPMKKGATSPEALADYVRETLPPELHLLGLGVTGRAAKSILGLIAELSPATKITMDSNRIRAVVGTDKPKAPPPPDERQTMLLSMRNVMDLAKAKGDPAAHHKYLSRKPDGHGGWDYTYAPKTGYRPRGADEHPAQLSLFAQRATDARPRPWRTSEDGAGGAGLQILSLFTGVGGLDLGLEAALPQAETIGHVESEPYPRQVLARHWPDVPQHADVREVAAAAREGRLKRLPNMVIGGFPCQDVSLAGKGAGLAGERTGLYHEMLAIVEHTRPDWVVAENVPGLRSRGLDTVLADLAGLGYSLSFDGLPAAAVGAPHMRDRVFVVAHRPGVAFNFADAKAWESWKAEDAPELRDPAGRAGRDTRTPQLKAAGNAVVPAVGQAVGNAIAAAKPGAEERPPWAPMSKLVDGQWSPPLAGRRPRAGKVIDGALYAMPTAHEANRPLWETAQEGDVVWVRNPEPTGTWDSQALVISDALLSDELPEATVENVERVVAHLAYSAEHDDAPELPAELHRLAAAMAEDGAIDVDDDGVFVANADTLAIAEGIVPWTYRGEGGANDGLPGTIFGEPDNDPDGQVDILLPNGDVEPFSWDYLQRYPTPSASDWRGGFAEGTAEGGVDPIVDKRIKGAQLRHWVDGGVNPRFAEWLMGLPAGWLHEPTAEPVPEPAVKGAHAALLDLVKHKYRRRWRGKDGRWQYEYDDEPDPRQHDLADLPPRKHGIAEKIAKHLPTTEQRRDPEFWLGFLLRSEEFQKSVPAAGRKDAEAALRRTVTREILEYVGTNDRTLTQVQRDQIEHTLEAYTLPREAQAWRILDLDAQSGDNGWTPAAVEVVRRLKNSTQERNVRDAAAGIHVNLQPWGIAYSDSEMLHSIAYFGDDSKTRPLDKDMAPMPARPLTPMQQAVSAAQASSAQAALRAHKFDTYFRGLYLDNDIRLAVKEGDVLPLTGATAWTPKSGLASRYGNGSVVLRMARSPAVDATVAAVGYDLWEGPRDSYADASLPRELLSGLQGVRVVKILPGLPEDGAQASTRAVWEVEPVFDLEAGR